MRGADRYNEVLFSTIRLEKFVPANHQLPKIRAWLNEALTKMDARYDNVSGRCQRRTAKHCT